MMNEQEQVEPFVTKSDATHYLLMAAHYGKRVTSTLRTLSILLECGFAPTSDAISKRERVAESDAACAWRYAVAALHPDEAHWLLRTDKPSPIVSDEVVEPKV